MRAASLLLTARHSDVEARLLSAADSRRDRASTSSCKVNAAAAAQHHTYGEDKAIHEYVRPDTPQQAVSAGFCLWS
jgi:hypothetical protein